MKHHRTYRRKHYVKRKTRHQSRKNRTRRHRKGGVRQNRMNNMFEDRLGDLINELQDIIDSININQYQKEHYINQILSKLNEARVIDQHFGNQDMEQQIAQRIADVLVKYDPNMRNREISEAEFGQIINQARRNYINQ